MTIFALFVSVTEMRFNVQHWRKKLLALVAWFWLLLAIAPLFPIPLAWVAGGTAGAVAGTILLAGDHLRRYVWVITCLPAVLSLCLPLSLPPALPLLPRLGLTVGWWALLVMLAVAGASYLSQSRPEPASLE